MGKLLLILAAAAVGTLIPYQGTVNSRLGQALGQPFLAALVSFTGGTLTVLLVNLVVYGGLPRWEPKGPTPWYLFTGGLPGVVFVTTTLVLMPRIGVAATVGSMLMGQLVGSLLFDHFGLLGMAVRPLNAKRLLGATLLAGGVLLIVGDRAAPPPTAVETADP